MRINFSPATVILTASALVVSGLPVLTNTNASKSFVESISYTDAVVNSTVTVFSVAPPFSSSPAPVSLTQVISPSNSTSSGTTSHLNLPACDIASSENTVNTSGASNLSCAVEPGDIWTNATSTTESSDLTCSIDTSNSTNSTTVCTVNPTTSNISTPFPNSTVINDKSLRRPHLEGDPHEQPVTVVSLDQRATMQCGSTTFNHDEIIEAVIWGTLLQDAVPYKGRGVESREYPHGRFPHDYTSDQYSFNDQCPHGDDNRQEYPVMKGQVYNGGLRNKEYGVHRVVYYRKPGETGADGHSLVYFCGGVTHEGAPSHNKFVQCTVQLL